VADSDTLTSITPDDAQRLVANARESLRLNGLEAIDAATAEVLALYSGSLELNAMASLEPAVVACLAARKGGSLSLDNIFSLTAETERALARYDGHLRLAGITKLCTTAMAEKYTRGEVQMGPIKFLSPEAAAGIAPEPLESTYEYYEFAEDDASEYEDDQYEDMDECEDPSDYDLDLPHLELLTPEAAEALAHVVQGRIWFKSLKSICAQAAFALRSHDRDLRLDGIEAVDDDTAEALAQHDGPLRMPGLRILTNASLAEKLVEPDDNGSYELPELLEVSDEAAMALSEAENGTLTVGGLRSLSLSAAKAFAQCRHSLELTLDHLAELTDECAKALAEFCGKSLCLGRPHAISPQAEEILRSNSLIKLDSLEQKIAKHSGIEMDYLIKQLTLKASRLERPPEP